MKMLGPWPVLQFMFGVAVMGGGVWMIIRGTQKQDRPPPALEDQRDKWAAYDQLRNIEENSFKMVEHLRLMREDIQRLGTILWNRDVLRPPPSGLGGRPLPPEE